MLANRTAWSWRFILILVLSLICATAIVQARTITVGRSGCNYSSVQQAINAADYGDTVLVQPGSYYGTIKMKDGITLLASDDGEVRLYSDYSPVIMVDGSIGATISGFLIEYTGEGENSAVWVLNSPIPIVGNVIRGATYSGIHVTGDEGYGPLIRGNTITGNAGDGIYVEGQECPWIRENLITENGGSGIHSRDYTVPSVEGNTIHDNAKNGIFTSGGSGGSFENNRVFSNGQKGIYVTDTSRPSIRRNTIFGNAEEGISVVRTSRFPDRAYYMEVSDNEIYDHPHAGVFIGDRTELLLIWNTIHGNFEGVCVADEADVDIERNEIYENRDAGVEVKGDSTSLFLDNTIHDNEKCGIFAWGAASGEICDNQINGNGHKGIYLTETANFLTEGNEISGNTHEGISIVGSTQRTVSGNEIRANGFAGIFVGETASVILTDNVITGNLHEGICVAGDSGATIRGNSISNNVYVGIRTQDSATAIIEGNTVSGNAEHGIFAIGSSGGEISGNTIRENMLYGIFVQDEASPSIGENVVSDNGRGTISIRGSEPPGVVTIDCPSTIPTEPLNAAIAVTFHDSDANLQTAKFEVVEGDLADFVVDLTQPPYAEQVSGVVDGAFEIEISVPEPGSYRLQVTLVDSAGLESSPTEFAFQAFTPHAPAVLTISATELIEIPQKVDGLVRYEDVDRDITQASFEVLEGSLDDFTLDLTQPPYAEQVAGLAEGGFSFEIVPEEPGTYRIQVTLVDATGLESEPVEFAFEVFTPAPPAITRVTFPSSIGIDKDQNGLVRFEDSDGDIVEARFEIVEGDASAIEIDPGLSFDPEVEGEADGAFRFTVRVTQPQTITLRLILVDAVGLESDPYEFTFTVE